MNMNSQKSLYSSLFTVNRPLFIQSLDPFHFIEFALLLRECERSLGNGAAPPHAVCSNIEFQI